MKRRRKRARKHVHLGEDLIAEILIRLPAKSVLRARAVCKEWRRITTGQAFLAAHARHGPLDVLLYSYDNDLVKLDAVTVSAVTTPGRRRFVQFPEKHPHRPARHYCLLLASCDGLLLLKNQYTGHHHVCNLATRQWADLPPISGVSPFMQQECGFYFHEPSGEYRLLSHVTATPASYYVFSAGSGEPRRLNVQATPIHVGSTTITDSFNYLTTPAVVGGHLHWLWHPEAGLTEQMVAFDTVAETFRRMSPPPVTSSSRHSAKLLAVDGRLMAASEFRKLLVDLWVLEDYGGAGERWEIRYRVEVPWKMSWTLTVVAGNDEGDVILSSRRGLVMYNVRSKMIRVIDVEFESTQGLHLSRCVIRQSLVPRRFFEARQHSVLPLLTFF